MERYAPDEEFLMPRDDQRVVVVGRTGSGKTIFAMALLSEASFDIMPWIIFDFKHDDFFRDLVTRGFATVIPLGEIPAKPGLYIVQPLPDRDKDAVEAYLWEILRRENIGIVVDELYMIDPRSDAMNGILTQGRSKHIPMINLTQRPVSVSRWNFSEASHIVVFHLNHIKDRQTVAEHMPIDKNIRLPEYKSRWYDVNRDKLFQVQPAPGREIILQRFAERLKPEEGEDIPQRIIL